MPFIEKPTYHINFSWLLFLDIESQICAKMTKEDGIWSCRECIYTSRTKGHVYEHIEAKHVHHGGYICPKCSKLLKTRASLRMHSKHYHSTMK